MFTNPRPTGWTDGVDKITGYQIGQIATQLVNAIDSASGGIYALGAGKTIVFQPGGGGWAFGCDVAFASTSTVTFAGSVSWSGTASFGGAVTCASSLGVAGIATFAASVSCATSLFCGTTFHATGLATFSGGVTFSGTNTITGASSTTVVLPGVTKLTGRTVDRAPAYKSTANVTLDQNTGANRIIMLAAPVSNIVVTLRQSTAPIPENGDWFEVTVLLGTSGWTVVLQREGSLDFVAVLGDGVGGTGNQVASARVELVAGVWRLMSVGGRYAFYGIDA